MRKSVERETVGKGGKPRASAERRNEYFHHLDKVTISFFFTNILEDATYEVLSQVWKGGGNLYSKEA
jgi:hypothetical protein